MGFMDSYKRLEKLCGEILNEDRPIKAYIEEMNNTPRGAYLVSGWDSDLKRLQHYLRVRNKISHEPDCSEENMCNWDDALWLDEFRSRIMNQTDPLALYRKAMQVRAANTSKVSPRQLEYTYNAKPNKSGDRTVMLLWYFVTMLFVILLLVYWGSR
jgi:hypothetical protein